MMTVTLMQAYITSFTDDKTGVAQHRVLLSVSAEDALAVEATRDLYIRIHGNSDKVALRTPHVSHSIHSTLVEAEEAARLLNVDILPYTVKVTGVAID